MSRFALSTALLLAGTLGAHAEIQRFSDVVQALDNPGPARSTVSDRVPLRMQVSYQIQEPAERAAPLDAQVNGIQAAHAQLYRVIGQECGLIAQAFGGDCRVVSINAGNGSQNFGPAPLMTYTASAVFEVAVPAASPPKPK